MMQPLLIALQFLTRLPVPLREAPQPQALGRSLLCYPLVGALIGAALLALAQLPLPPLLHAALLLALWVGISGGLHLDGLADCADAWVGGHGDRERTLMIMKDPRSGPMGVTAIVLVLLLKFAALATLLEARHSAMLWLIPVLARTAMPALFASTDYVRADGLGSTLAAQLPRRAAWTIVLLVLLLACGCGVDGTLLVLVGIACFAVVRSMLQRRLDGFSGDGAGAMLELIETSTLLVLAMISA